MEGPRDDGKDSTAKLTLGTSPRALAELNYNALIAPDRNASSDDDVPEDAQIPAEDARTAIGVSISREQIRLTSPQTPAVEKAAAIDRQGGFFGVDGSVREATLLEEPEEDEEVDVEDEDEDVATEIRDNEDDSGTSTPLAAPKIPERSPRRTPVRLPSPWRAESSVQWYQNNKGRSGIFDGLFNRKRSSTGPDTTLAKSFLSSLPSIPKSFSIGSSSTGTNDVKTMSRTTSNESPKAMSFKPPSDFEKNHNSSAEDPCEPASGIENTSKSTEVKDRHAALEAVVSPASAPSVRSRAALLRRSTSDQSLVTQRTLSRVETLGDDSRFENVQDQVNSRFKAIKDSWQDSNIRLPSLPNISIASFTPDFIRERSGSLNKRSSIRPVDSVDSTSRSVESGMKPQKPVDPMTRQPYSTAREAVADATSGKPSTHPNFKRALEQLEDDVVILGGYRGSILRSADPPHRQLWVPVKVGLNLRKVDMQVGFEEDGDERATDRIIPGGMLTHIGPVDIARRLFKRLRNCKNAQSGKLRVYDYGYDWRLDPNYLSNQLISFLEGLPCNQPKHRKERRGAIVIAHSLGGLITRHAVNQRPDLFRGVVYAGVPTTCVNILGPLRNGDEVLLSNRVLTAQVNFSIRTSFALLPLDGRCFFDKNTGEVSSSIFIHLHAGHCILTEILGISRGFLRPRNMDRFKAITLCRPRATSTRSSTSTWRHNRLRFFSHKRFAKHIITRSQG